VEEKMKTRILINFFLFLFTLVYILFPGKLKAQNSRELLDLRGDWKFKLGDNPHWADAKFDDSKWSGIYVPANWEDEGYPNYDGYAWYRMHFSVEKDWQSKDLMLDLGLIDDVDEAFVNGQSVGSSGDFPPDYNSAYNTPRNYPVPEGLLQPGKDNVIAVRVYDGGGVGGINQGRIGLYERRNSIPVDIKLPLTWKFIPGDELKWKEIKYNDQDWKTVRVPAYWETQGFKDYDGFGWYRVTFNVPSEFKDKDLIMLLGKIDDYDEAYLNGEKIGRTGPRLTEDFDSHYTNSDAYQQVRAYTIPGGLLKAGRENVLAVRVYDCWNVGGIYEGPIGVITREHFQKYKHNIKYSNRWFKNFLEDLFN
jgi:sialate O-acetylesterase